MDRFLKFENVHIQTNKLNLMQLLRVYKETNKLNAIIKGRQDNKLFNKYSFKMPNFFKI